MNNNADNSYQTTLSGNIKYINNFITSLSGNLYVNYLTQTNASSISAYKSNNYLTVENASYYLLKSDASIIY